MLPIIPRLRVGLPIKCQPRSERRLRFQKVWHQFPAVELGQAAGFGRDFVVLRACISSDAGAANGKGHVAVGVSFGAQVGRVIGRYQNTILFS